MSGVEVLSVGGDGIHVVSVHDPSEPIALVVGGTVVPVPVLVPGTGGSSGDTFVIQYQQQVPQSVWGPFEHPDGYPVAWSLRTAAGELGWNYAVDSPDSTHTRVSMDTPTAGTVYILMRRA